jgi:hypothetical protein
MILFVIDKSLGGLLMKEIKLIVDDKKVIMYGIEFEKLDTDVFIHWKKYAARKGFVYDKKHSKEKNAAYLTNKSRWNRLLALYPNTCIVDDRERVNVDMLRRINKYVNDLVIRAQNCYYELCEMCPGDEYLVIDGERCYVSHSQKTARKRGFNFYNFAFFSYSLFGTVFDNYLTLSYSRLFFSFLEEFEKLKEIEGARENKLNQEGY